MATLHIDELPLEVVYHMLSYLDLTGLLRMARASRCWRLTVEDCVKRRRHLSNTDFSAGGVTHNTLQKALKRMPYLRSLRVTFKKGYKKWCDGDLRIGVVARRCPQLEEIDLRHFDVNEVDMRHLALACPRLKTVVLPGMCDDASALGLLDHLSGVRSLTLAKTAVTGKCLDQLPTSLEELSLADCTCLDPADLRVLVRCTALRELDVSRLDGLRDADLSPVLAACRQLQRLSAAGLDRPLTLERCLPRAGPQLRRLGAAGLERPLTLERCLPQAGLPALRHLDVPWSDAVTDSTLEQLTSLLPDLESLNIDNCDKVTDTGLSCLPLFRKLRCLSLIGLECVTDSILYQLHDSPLTELMLGSGPFTERGLIRLLLSCTSMQSLWLDTYNRNLLKKLLECLAGRLAPNRNVTLFVLDDMLQQLTPPTTGPLQVAKWEYEYDSDDDDDFDMEEEEDEDEFTDEMDSDNSSVYFEEEEEEEEEEMNEDGEDGDPSENGGDDNSDKDDSSERPGPGACLAESPDPGAGTDRAVPASAGDSNGPVE